MLYYRSVTAMGISPVARIFDARRRHAPRESQLIHSRSCISRDRAPRQQARTSGKRRRGQSRRVTMISFLLSLITEIQARSKSVPERTGFLCRTASFSIPCPTASHAPDLAYLLPVIFCIEGQHEKNANQRNSGRGVADGDGRWPAPL